MATSGLPYHMHHQFATTADMFPSHERFEGARQMVSDRATFRSMHTSSTSGEAPRTVRSLSLEPADESADKKAFTHYLEKHVMSASIIPVREARHWLLLRCSLSTPAARALAGRPLVRGRLCSHPMLSARPASAVPWPLQLPSKASSSASASAASGKSKR